MRRANITENVHRKYIRVIFFFIRITVTFLVTLFLKTASHFQCCFSTKSSEILIQQFLLQTNVSGVSVTQLNCRATKLVSRSLLLIDYLGRLSMSLVMEQYLQSPTERRSLFRRQCFFEYIIFECCLSYYCLDLTIMRPDIGMKRAQCSLWFHESQLVSVQMKFKTKYQNRPNPITPKLSKLLHLYVCWKASI